MMMEVPQYAEIRYEDEQCLMKIAESEAEDQSVDGMALIMQVVLNRVEDEDYPNTIYEVISDKGQFQSFANGRYDLAVPGTNARLALEEIKAGIFDDDTVIAFEVAGNRSLDKYFFYAFTLGGHDFYTEY